MKRSAYCGEISTKDIGNTVTVCGWVHKIRDHGGVLFIDVRDRSGIVQVVIEEKDNEELYKRASKLRSEYVVCIKGIVRKRPEGTENPKLKTGYVEILMEDLDILNTSDILPFPVDEETKVSEEIKLRYRYIDLRRESMKENIIFRHKLYQITRRFFDEKGFIEIETPFLTKSTPEGARDFIVPSRLHPHKFYALPQSPQLFKQILMIAGFDRYFQIVKCLRDEDLRADRQPEFTQIDFEMSFVDEEDVMEVCEDLIVLLFRELINVKLDKPFPRITYNEAMEVYGTDKPDRRFDMTLVDLTDILRNTEFKIFRKSIDEGGAVKSITLKGVSISRKEIDEITEFARGLGAPGLAWIKIEGENLTSPITKFLSKEEIKNILERSDAKEGDIIFFSSGRREEVNRILGQLRLYLAKKYDLIDNNKWDIVWIVDFPLFEWDEEERRFVSLHHPFTSPKLDDVKKLEELFEVRDLEKQKELASQIKARAYDLVINGEEIGGGSIRIHREDIQKLIFGILSIDETEAKEKFGFLLEALKYGAPPHGGFAFGLDRLVALMRGLDSIRDVIAFPKTQKGICPLTEAPDYVSPKQLREVHIKVE